MSYQIKPLGTTTEPGWQHRLARGVSFGAWQNYDPAFEGFGTDPQTGAEIATGVTYWLYARNLSLPPEAEGSDQQQLATAIVVTPEGRVESLAPDAVLCKPDASNTPANVLGDLPVFISNPQIGQMAGVGASPTGEKVFTLLPPRTLDQTAKTGTPDEKGWTDQLLSLMGGLFLGNIPPTSLTLPALVLDRTNGRVYTGPVTNNNTGSGGTVTAVVTYEWLNAVAEWVTIWQERVNGNLGVELPGAPQLGGGTTTPTSPTSPTTNQPQVNNVYQRFDPTPNVGHVLELNASYGDYFLLRVIGRDGTNFNGQWNEATRTGGNTANGTYAYFGINLLPQGNYKVQGQVKGNTDVTKIVSRDFAVTAGSVVAIDEFAVRGNTAPVEGGDYEQYELWQKYSDGSYKKHTGYVIFVATIFVSGITLTEAGQLQIPDGTISEPTDFVVRAFTGNNYELPIVIQPKVSTPVVLDPIVNTTLVYIDGAGRVWNGNVRTKVELKIRTEHPKGTFFSETAFSSDFIKLIGGNYDATGASVERPFGNGIPDAGEWFYTFITRPVDQVTYPGEKYWRTTSYLNVNSGSSTPTNPTSPSNPPSSGTTTPWELDLDEPKLIKAEWQWVKNDPSAGNGSVLTLYWTVQGIDALEVNYFITAFGSNNNQYTSFPNIGSYGNGVNSLDRTYNITAGKTLELNIRKKGTTAVLHNFSLTMPTSATSQTRTTFYQAP